MIAWKDFNNLVKYLFWKTEIEKAAHQQKIKVEKSK